MRDSNPSGCTILTSSTSGHMGIVFLHKLPEQLEMMPTLNTLKAFVEAWNAGHKDSQGRAPKKGVPAKVIGVTAVFHPSTADARPHLTLKVFTSTGWTSDPKLAQSTIHVYCNGNKVEGGYSTYKLHDTNNDKLSSPYMRLRIKTALDHPFGTWSGATIAEFPSEHEGQVTETGFVEANIPLPLSFGDAWHGSADQTS